MIRRTAHPFAVALAVALVLAADATVSAQAQGVTDATQRTEMTVIWPRATPYAGEMIVLRMRSAIRATIALYDMRQPSLAGFDWQQFGHDTAYETEIDGYTVAGIERVLAIFARRDGPSTIPPFVRHVTLVTAGNRRVEADFASKPLEIEVASPAALIPPGTFWLPATGVRLTETWEPQAGDDATASVIRRTLVIEATGTIADRLPPSPEMKGPGFTAFAGPVVRETVVTEYGPAARATYRWEIVPRRGQPAQAPAIHIPWFDTAERQMREAFVPAHDLLAAPATASAPGPNWQQIAAFWPAAMGAGVWTVALAYVASHWNGSFLRRNRSATERGILATLRRSARKNDVAAFRRELLALSRLSPERWDRLRSREPVRQSLQTLDRSLYAAQPAPRPALAPLANDIARFW